MRVIPIALDEHYALDATTVATMVKLTRTDSFVRGYTSSPVPLVYDGLTYEPGFDASTTSSTATLGVDNLEIKVQPDGDTALDAALIAGLWDYAAFEVFEVNVQDLTTGHRSPPRRGRLGQVKFGIIQYVGEMLGLTSVLQQTQGQVTSKNCRARLGDSKCTQNLSAFTVTGTLTAVDGAEPQRIFTDSSRSEVGGWFAEGIIGFTAGANGGISRKVKIFESGGAFALSTPFPYPAVVGDAYTLVAGCDKTLATCIAKFGNVLNFQGEPHLPGLDALSKPGSAPAQAADVAPTVTDEPGSAGDGGP